jgi:hypothetical protein
LLRCNRKIDRQRGFPRSALLAFDHKDFDDGSPRSSIAESGQ